MNEEKTITKKELLEALKNCSKDAREELILELEKLV